MEINKGTLLGLPTILFLTFLVLKLTGYIAWSWWWVTSPLWIAAILACVVLGFMVWFLTSIE